MVDRDVNSKAIVDMIRLMEQTKGPAVALGEAARWSETAELKRLLETYRDADLKIPPNDVTPLMLASSPKIARMLVDAGADVNARDNRGITPIVWFLKLQFSKKVATTYLRKLIQLGAEIDAVDEMGTSAKTLAMQKYQIDLEQIKTELSNE